MRDILRVYKENPKFTSSHIIQMLKILYSNSHGPSIEIEDDRFDKLNGLLEGMKKIFAIQVETLSEILSKVNQLSKRKEQREKKGPSFFIKM